MSKFHIRGDGTVGQCYASVKDCPLGVNLHFSTEEDANKVSQLIMENQFGVILPMSADEAKLKEAEIPREEQASYNRFKVYNNEIYAFDEEKEALAKTGIKKLNERKFELEFILRKVSDEPTAKLEDVEKIKDNIKFVDEKIALRKDQYKQKKRKSEARELERIKSKRIELAKADELRLTRESNYDSHSGNDYGDSSG